MATRDTRQLQKLVTSMQRRWGARALYSLPYAPVAAQESIATGYAGLDTALGIGGIPRGRMSEFVGIATSGMTTLAFRVIRNAQAENDAAVYLDPEDTFDPDYAAGCGVDLDRLLLVRSVSSREAVSIASDLIISGCIGILVIDLTARTDRDRNALTFRSLIPALAHSGSVLLLLAQTPVCDHTALRLEFTRQEWRPTGKDVRGYRVAVRVVKNKFAPANQEVDIEIDLCDGDRGGRS